MSANAKVASAKPVQIPVIDTHVHQFDPRRPQGAPYTGPRGQPPQIALPQTYHKLAAPTGIVGAITIRCRNNTMSKSPASWHSPMMTAIADA